MTVSELPTLIVVEPTPVETPAVPVTTVGVPRNACARAEFGARASADAIAQLESHALWRRRRTTFLSTRFINALPMATPAR
jgi:hypothetical protein